MERETEAYEGSPETEGVLGAATPCGQRRQGERAFHDMLVRCNVASRNPTLGSGTFTGSGAGEQPEFGPVLQPQMPQRLQSTRSANL